MATLGALQPIDQTQPIGGQRVEPSEFFVLLAVFGGSDEASDDEAFVDIESTAARVRVLAWGIPSLVKLTVMC
jgi:hypothetical protein